jgi:hypothetical protein
MYRAVTAKENLLEVWADFTDRLAILRYVSGVNRKTVMPEKHVRT